ncbi:unnamed protein product [Rotaria sordida]|uniref:Uncharacterized protein n=2 Tax=Rotaria sordida TaxID=392033 RepID=A0A814AWB1_9BILA|nr:unnamed protein product [Rotaria sordida]
MKPLEAEIRHLFNHHMSMLCNQKWKIIDEITKWSTTLISQIQEHVTQQRKFLDQVYEKKVFCLNTIRDRILKQALIYEQKEDNEQVNQWLNQCNTLKLELATLNYINRPISTIQLVAEEQSIQPNTDDEQNEQKTEVEQSPIELIDNNEKNIINNTDTNEYEPPQVTSTNTASINTPSLLTKSMNNEDQSIINNSKLKNNVSNDNELLGKCPVCFMIFPQIRQCQSETEIRNLFERHMKVLYDQKQKMINEIAEWENNLIRQIQENVANQKTLLEQECKYQLNYLQAKCQEFLDTALIYEENKNREEVRQLIEQCHAVKFEIGVFEYPERLIPFIKMQKEQQRVELKQDVFNTHQLNSKSTNNDNFRIDNNKNLYASTSSMSTFASSNQINQQLLTTLSSVDNNHLITDNNNRNSNMINHHDILNKCPVCFIIFPSTIGTSERSKHVNQHFGDS